MEIRQTPWMADCEVEIMDSIFRTQRPKRVLEWGAGGSTLYWPPKYDFIEEWKVIEQDKEFAKALKGQVADKVYVSYATGKQYWHQAAEYDMIIVDGHYRLECLEAALGLLADGGIVVLHDSGRSAYNEAWKFWPHCEELYLGEKFIQYDCGYWTPNAKPGEGYYKHRGIAVFWQDDTVETSGWCRQYAQAPLLRPDYVPPEVTVQEVKVNGDGEPVGNGDSMSVSFTTLEDDGNDIYPSATGSL